MGLAGLTGSFGSGFAAFSVNDNFLKGFHFFSLGGERAGRAGSGSGISYVSGSGCPDCSGIS